MPAPRGTPAAEHESETLAQFLALATVRRFDSLAGGSRDISPVVYLAALQVLRVVFADGDDAITALDEVEALEAAIEGRER
jgi:hypothetical protein